MTTSFVKEFTLPERISESNRILTKYPDRIPVIIDCIDKDLDKLLKKKKFLVPMDISISYLIQIIRNKVQLDSSKALYMYHLGVLLQANIIIGELYHKHVDATTSGDKFFYVSVAYESTFG